MTETGCTSWHGKRHIRCPSGDSCYEEGNSNQLSECGRTAVTQSCRTIEGHEGWKCKNGFCIKREYICDNKDDCHDNSDETEGCQLYSNSTCFSWFGLYHEKVVITGK